MRFKGNCPVTGKNEEIYTDDIYMGTFEERNVYSIGRVKCPISMDVDCKLPECPILKQSGMKIGSSYQA